MLKVVKRNFSVQKRVPADAEILNARSIAALKRARLESRLGLTRDWRFIVAELLDRNVPSEVETARNTDAGRVPHGR